MGSMKTIYGDGSALGAVNKYDDQYSRVLTRDGLNYETEPLVTGYFFLSFNFPKTLQTPAIKDYGAASKVNADTVLNAVNTGIDLPDFSISQVQIDGLGGTWNSVPGRLDVGKTVNVKYWETFNGEVTSINRQWLFQLRDPRSGVARPGSASAAKSVSTDYRQDKYKGQLWWFMTDPSMDRIIFAMEFLGIWPTNLPMSSVSNDIATNDKVELSITYSYDRPFFYNGTVNYSTTEFIGARFKMFTGMETKDKGNQKS